MNQTISALIPQLAAVRAHSLAIALDFDGVCKLFTEYKHQIMATAMFLHLREFQRVPFDVLRDAYVYINFRSPDYAGKERFLCVNALSEHLAKAGYRCALPGLHAAVAALRQRGLKISAANLQEFATDPDVKRALAWSEEINQRVALLTEIGLTPGILENIFQPFRDQADFFVVSTATEAPLRASLEKEGINFIKRYFGQETATKAEALTVLGHAGYGYVAMFGDSVEDERASSAAQKEYPAAAQLFFLPVIPGEEETCFKKSRQALEAVLRGQAETAMAISRQLTTSFHGREAGSRAGAPISIRA